MYASTPIVVTIVRSPVASTITTQNPVSPSRVGASSISIPSAASVSAAIAPNCPEPILPPYAAGIPWRSAALRML